MLKTDAKWLAGVLVAGLFAIFAFASIGDYGLTWDTPFHLLRGEAFLHFFLSGEKTYPQPLGDRGCIFQTRDLEWLLTSSYEGHHPALAGILSALGCEIFYKRLGLLKVIDAHHALVIILAGITILAVYLFGAQAYNNWRVGLFAAGFLALFPRFLGHAHNNIKDIPQTAFFVLTLWALWWGVSRKRWGPVLLSSIFFGLALAVKLTAGFLVPVVVVWLVGLKWEEIRLRRIKPNSRTLGLILLYPLLAAGVFFALWPYLWHDTLRHLGSVFNFYSKIGTSLAFHKGTTEHISRPYYPYALGYLGITTPLVVIAMGMVGLKISWGRIKQESDKVSLLILSWLFMVLFLVSLPGVHIYNGIRQFIFVVPALCIVAGLGAEHSYQWLKLRANKYWSPAKGQLAAWGVMGLLMGQLLVMVIWTHPNQTSFFNLAIGGLWGAQKIGVPEATDYWANSYRAGVRWLNQHAQANSLLNVAFGEDTVAAAKELRPDIKLTSFEEIQEKYPAQAGYVMFVTKRSWYNYRTDYCHRNLKPAHVIKVQGAPILEIYKYEEKQA